jgi:hypothetical protein
MINILTFKRIINSRQKGAYTLFGWHKTIKTETGDIIIKKNFGPLRLKISNRNIACVIEQRKAKEAEEAAKKAAFEAEETAKKTADPTYEIKPYPAKKERKAPEIDDDPRFPEFLHLSKKDGRSYFYVFPTLSPKHKIHTSFTLNGEPITRENLIASGIVSEEDISGKGVTTCMVIHLDEVDKIVVDKKKGGK